MSMFAFCSTPQGDAVAEVAADPLLNTYPEFVVEVRKDEGSWIGINLDTTDGQTAHVCYIGDGVINQYNEGTDGVNLHAIQAGDYIYGVNGVEFQVKEMLEQIKQSSELRLQVVRAKYWNVWVDRDVHTGELGVDVNWHPTGASLLVRRIVEGKIAQWNEMNPMAEIKPNDRIVEVNGILAAGNVAPLLDQLRDSFRLDMVVARPDWRIEAQSEEDDFGFQSQARGPERRQGYMGDAEDRLPPPEAGVKSAAWLRGEEVPNSAALRFEESDPAAGAAGCCGTLCGGEAKSDARELRPAQQQEIPAPQRNPLDDKALGAQEMNRPIGGWYPSFLDDGRGQNDYQQENFSPLVDRRPVEENYSPFLDDGLRQEIDDPSSLPPYQWNAPRQQVPPGAASKSSAWLMGDG